MDKQSLCIDILVSGHVQAYVDFFYLTHRPEVDLAESEEPQEEQAQQGGFGIAFACEACAGKHRKHTCRKQLSVSKHVDACVMVCA